MHFIAHSSAQFPEVAFHAKTIANKHKQKQTKSPTVCRGALTVVYATAQNHLFTKCLAAVAHIHKESSLSSASTNPLKPTILVTARWWDSLGAIFPGDGFNFRRYRQPHTSEQKNGPSICPSCPRLQGFLCLFLTADANCAANKIETQNSHWERAYILV